MSDYLINSYRKEVIDFTLVGFKYYVSSEEFNSYGPSTTFEIQRDRNNQYNRNAIAAYYHGNLVAYVSNATLDRVLRVIDREAKTYTCKFIERKGKHIEVRLSEECSIIKEDNLRPRIERIYTKFSFEYNPIYDYEFQEEVSIVKTEIKWEFKDYNFGERKLKSFSSGKIAPNTIFSLLFEDGCPVVVKKRDKWGENNLYFVIKENRLNIHFCEFVSHKFRGENIPDLKSVIPLGAVSNPVVIYDYIKNLGEHQKYITRTTGYCNYYYETDAEHGDMYHVYRKYPYIEMY